MISRWLTPRRVAWAVPLAAAMFVASVAIPAARSGRRDVGPARLPADPWGADARDIQPEGTVTPGLLTVDLGDGHEGFGTDQGQWVSITLWRAGWPVHAAEARLREYSSGDLEVRGGRLAPAWLAPTSGDALQFHRGTPRVIPWRPVWPGAAVAAGLAFAAALACTTALGASLESVRRRRNRCSACGHPRDPSRPGATCPECGASAGG